MINTADESSDTSPEIFSLINYFHNSLSLTSNTNSEEESLDDENQKKLTSNSVFIFTFIILEDCLKMPEVARMKKTYSNVVFFFTCITLFLCFAQAACLARLLTYFTGQYRDYTSPDSFIINNNVYNASSIHISCGNVGTQSYICDNFVATGKNVSRHFNPSAGSICIKLVSTTSNPIDYLDDGYIHGARIDSTAPVGNTCIDCLRFIELTYYSNQHNYTDADFPSGTVAYCNDLLCGKFKAWAKLDVLALPIVLILVVCSVSKSMFESRLCTLVLGKIIRFQKPHFSEVSNSSFQELTCNDILSFILIFFLILFCWCQNFLIPVLTVSVCLYLSSISTDSFTLLNNAIVILFIVDIDNTVLSFISLLSLYAKEAIEKSTFVVIDDKYDRININSTQFLQTIAIFISSMVLMITFANGTCSPTITPSLVYFLPILTLHLIYVLTSSHTNWLQRIFSESKTLSYFDLTKEFLNIWILVFPALIFQVWLMINSYVVKFDVNMTAFQTSNAPESSLPTYRFLYWFSIVIFIFYDGAVLGLLASFCLELIKIYRIPRSPERLFRIIPELLCFFLRIIVSVMIQLYARKFGRYTYGRCPGVSLLDFSITAIVKSVPSYDWQSPATLESIQNDYEDVVMFLSFHIFLEISTIVTIANVPVQNRIERFGRRFAEFVANVAILAVYLLTTQAFLATCY